VHEDRRCSATELIASADLVAELLTSPLMGHAVLGSGQSRRSGTKVQEAIPERRLRALPNVTQGALCIRHVRPSNPNGPPTPNADDDHTRCILETASSEIQYIIRRLGRDHALIEPTRWPFIKQIYVVGLLPRVTDAPSDFVNWKLEPISVRSRDGDYIQNTDAKGRS